MHTPIKLSPKFEGIYKKMMKRIGRNRAIIAIARKLSVVIYKILEKKKELVEDHVFRTLNEKKLKRMVARSERSKRFQQGAMEKVIKWVGFQSKSAKLLS